MKNLRLAFQQIASEHPETRPVLVPLLKQGGSKWEKLPKGWTDESVKKFWESLVGENKHKVTTCINKMQDKFEEPGAFCASLADKVDPGWRQRAKKADNAKQAKQAKQASADVKFIRQQTQYTCMAASLAASLNAIGKDVTEGQVNKVMGAAPLRGASWEDLLLAAQYFGARATLVVPSTLKQVRAWTDKGIPVMIAYNPEGRPWSHASVIFDVTDTEVKVMDPNIPNPEETTRVYSHNDFYKVWIEAAGDKIVRRPACAIEKEFDENGR